VRRIFPGDFVLGTGILGSVLPMVVLLVALPVAAGGGHRGGRDNTENCRTRVGAFASWTKLGFHRLFAGLIARPFFIAPF
jgi:hypothetical protein